MKQHRQQEPTTDTSDMPSVETYEALFERLQDVVTCLESGNLTLEETVALYEQGTALVTACQTLLDNAELRIVELQITTNTN